MNKYNREKIAGKKFAHAPNLGYKDGTGFRGKKFTVEDQLDWMRRQKEYAAFAEKVKTRYDLRKGEIYEFDFGINVNAEFSMRHYGVVMCDSSIYNPLVIVCPLKTNHHGAHPRSDVDLGIIPSLCTTSPTVAVVNQIRSIDKLRLYTKNAIGTTIGEDGEVISRNDISTCIDGNILKLDDYNMKRISDLYAYILAFGDSDHCGLNRK